MMKKISLLALSLLLSNSGYANLEHNKVLDEALDVVLDEAAQEELRNLVVNAVLSGKLTQAQAEQILVGTKSSEKSSDKDLTKRYFAAGVVTGLALIGGGYCVYQLCKTSPKKDEATVPNSENRGKPSGDEQPEVENNSDNSSDDGQSENALRQSSMDDLFFVDSSLIPVAQRSPSHHSDESQSESGSSTYVEEVVQLAQNSPSHHSDESSVDDLYEVVPLSQRHLSQANIAALNFEEDVNRLAQEGRRSPAPSQVSVASTNVSTASRRSSRVSVAPTHYGVYATPQQLSSVLSHDRPVKQAGRVLKRRK